MDTETTFSRWLRAEMNARGYAVGEPRSGGISKLAEDAGIPQASVSRILNGHAEPSLDNLRKIGVLFKISLPEMMIHAGLMEIEELRLAALRLGPFTESGIEVIAASIPDYEHLDPSFPEEIRREWVNYEPWEKMIWHLPLPVEERWWIAGTVKERMLILARGIEIGRAEAAAEARKLGRRNGGSRAS